jgi:hypothetical protein
MKLLLTALCASFMVIPAAFASDCEKGGCGKDKKEEGTLVAEGKCKKDCDDDKKSEGTLAEGKCKKDCDDDKKAEGTLAHCGKCEGDHKKKDGEAKKEGTLA